MEYGKEEPLEAPTEEEFDEEEEEELYEEGPPRTIEIRPPPGFEEPALAPFIDLYMEKRGLKNRSQAAIKLAGAMWSMGVNPQKEMQNVTDYLNNMNLVLESIPNTDETSPIKGALYGRSATEASNIVRKTYLGAGGGLEEDVEKLMQYGARMKMTMKALDTAFGDEGGSKLNPELEEIRRRLDARDEQDKFNSLINPLREQITNLATKIEKLGENQGKGPSPEATEITKTLSTITSRLENIEQRYQFDQQFGALKDEFNKVTTKLATMEAGGGASGKGSVAEVLDTLLVMRGKLAELSGEAPAGEVDWKATGISVFGETLQEGIRAVRDIKTGEEPEKKNTKKQGISEKVIDRLVGNYCRAEIAKGNFEVKTDLVARELEITSKQAFDSIMRLRDQGVFSTSVPRSEGAETEQGRQPERGTVVEP